MFPLKLTKLHEKELAERLQAQIRGGEQQQCQTMCICGCKGDTGDGQVNITNGTANMREGKFSPGGGTLYPAEDQQ